VKLPIARHRQQAPAISRWPSTEQKEALRAIADSCDAFIWLLETMLFAWQSPRGGYEGPGLDDLWHIAFDKVRSNRDDFDRLFAGLFADEPDISRSMCEMVAESELLQSAVDRGGWTSTQVPHRVRDLRGTATRFQDRMRLSAGAGQISSAA
jgi:hypothetical protein